MPIRTRREVVMKTTYLSVISVLLLLLTRTTYAEEVNLPAPVLEWSLYILLIFAATVVIAIFFARQGKNGENDSLHSLLGEQDTAIHSVHADVAVTECVRQMNEHKIGAMLVMQHEQLLGIFTERDAITRVLGEGLDPHVTKVSEVMTENPVCVTTSTTLGEAMGIITNQHIRHLPVVEDGKVLWMVSSGDITRRLVENLPGEIRELVNIAGQRGRSR